MFSSSNRIQRMQKANQPIQMVQKPATVRFSVLRSIEDVVGKRVMFRKVDKRGMGETYEGTVLAVARNTEIDEYYRLLVQAARYENPVMVHVLDVLGFVGMVHVEAGE